MAKNQFPVTRCPALLRTNPFRTTFPIGPEARRLDPQPQLQRLKEQHSDSWLVLPGRILGRSSWAGREHYMPMSYLAA